MSIASIACFLALMIVQLGAQTCNDLPEDILRQAHVDAIKRAILFKLQFLEEPENPSGPIVVPQSVLDEYQAVSAALALVSQRQVGCMEQPDFPPKFVVLHPQDILRRSGYHGVHGEHCVTALCIETSSYKLNKSVSGNIYMSDYQCMHIATISINI